jgi:hypothetical protein
MEEYQEREFPNRPQRTPGDLGVEQEWAALDWETRSGYRREEVG